MNARTAPAALALLAALTLTGCAGATSSPSDDGSMMSRSTSETEAPLTAEPTSEPETGSDQAYLVQLRQALEGSGGNSIPDATDEQLIEAGQDACEQMAAGTALEEVRVVEDEPETGVGFKDSLRIAAVAAQHFCTEFNPGG